MPHVLEPHAGSPCNGSRHCGSVCDRSRLASHLGQAGFVTAQAGGQADGQGVRSCLKPGCPAVLVVQRPPAS